VEVEFAVAIGAFQEVDEFPAKDMAEDPHVYEKEILFPSAPLARNPAGPARSESAACHHAVDVGVTIRWPSRSSMRRLMISESLRRPCPAHRAAV
jgi:hypothetical protein